MSIPICHRYTHVHALQAVNSSAVALQGGLLVGIAQ